MKGYKRFNTDMTCIEFRYEEGKTYEMPADVISICQRGFHYCENPLETLNFYPLIDDNGNLTPICEVEAEPIKKSEMDSKCVTNKIHIGAKLDLKEFISAGIDYLRENFPTDDNIQASSVDYSKMASSGDYSQMASSGNYSQMASSFDRSQMASSGDCSQMASCSDCSKMVSSGENSVIAGIGTNNKAKAKKGSWITLAEWEYSISKNRKIPVCVKTEYVDGERIKEDVFYSLVGGEFKEVIS